MMTSRPLVLSCLYCALVSARLAAPSGQASARAKIVPSVEGSNQAIVVGVAHYSHAPILNLRYPTRDASAVADTLSARGFGVSLLTDERATNASVLREIAARRGVSGILVVYVSAHGVTTAAGPALLISDADPSNPATYLTWQELLRAFAGSKAQDIVVILDACQTGTNAPPPAFDVNPEAFRGRIHILSATTPNGTSYEYDELGQGAFTHFLLQGLQGAAADQKGKISVHALFKYVKTTVTAYSLSRGNLQVPQYLSSRDHALWSGSARATKETRKREVGPLTAALSVAPASISIGPAGNLVLGEFTWANASADFRPGSNGPRLNLWAIRSPNGFGWYGGHTSAHLGYDITSDDHLHIAAHSYLADFDDAQTAELRDLTAAIILGERAPLDDRSRKLVFHYDAEGRVLRLVDSSGSISSRSSHLSSDLVIVDQVLRNVGFVYDNSMSALHVVDTASPEKNPGSIRLWSGPENLHCAYTSGSLSFSMALGLRGRPGLAPAQVLDYAIDTFINVDTLPRFDKNVIFSAFDWPDAEGVTREIDMLELSRFENANDSNNAQNVVQPYTARGQLRFALPPSTPIVAAPQMPTPAPLGGSDPLLEYLYDARTRDNQTQPKRFVRSNRMFDGERLHVAGTSGSSFREHPASASTVWVLVHPLDLSSDGRSPDWVDGQGNFGAPLPLRWGAVSVASSVRASPTDASAMEQQVKLVATKEAVQMLDLGVKTEDPRYFTLLCTTYPQSKQCAEANWYMQDRSTVGYARGLLRLAPSKDHDEHAIQLLIALCAALSGALVTVIVVTNTTYNEKLRRQNRWSL